SLRVVKRILITELQQRREVSSLAPSVKLCEIYLLCVRLPSGKFGRAAGARLHSLIQHGLEILEHRERVARAERSAWATARAGIEAGGARHRANSAGSARGDLSSPSRAPIR